MKRYAVAHMNLFDNDLKIRIVEASDWRDALIKAFPTMDWIDREHNLEESKEFAFNSDDLFDVVVVQ